MVKASQALSMAPEDLGEGGAFPADKNMTVKSALVVVLEYGKGGVAGTHESWKSVSTKQNPLTTGVELVFEDEEGTEYNAQMYSIGEPQKFSPSKDGINPSDTGTCVIKNPEFTGDVKIPRGSNYGILIEETVNAGFPENKVGSDVKAMFEGLLAYWIQKEPKRSRTGTATTAKPIIVPETVIEYPGGKKAGKSGGKAAKEGGDSEEIAKKAMRLVKAALKDEDSITKADLAQAAIDTYADDDDRDEIASFIFLKDFDKALKAKGYTLDGTTISEEE